MREKFAIVFAIILVCGLSQAQKPRKVDMHEIIRQELELKRQEALDWKERWAKEYDQRKAAEFQLSQLRAAVARAAKL